MWLRQGIRGLSRAEKTIDRIRSACLGAGRRRPNIKSALNALTSIFIAGIAYANEPQFLGRGAIVDGYPARSLQWSAEYRVSTSGETSVAILEDVWMGDDRTARLFAQVETPAIRFDSASGAFLLTASDGQEVLCAESSIRRRVFRNVRVIQPTGRCEFRLAQGMDSSGGFVSLFVVSH